MPRKVAQPKKVKTKKTKRVKLEPLPKIKRRLHKLWLIRVRALWGNKCAISGDTGPGVLLHCHHIENRNTCKRLRYDPLNGILLTPYHHKWGKDSAHKGGIWFAAWLRKHHRPIYRYVLKNRREDINLDNREVLHKIEAALTEPLTDEEREMVRRS